MKRLLLPTRVRLLSCTVPRCRVAPSRMILLSPISSRVGSPLYFLSWQSSPTEANWKIRLPLPIRVGPRTTTCGPITVPAPISTSGPIIENGPTSTSAASSALGSTIALGCIISVYLTSAFLLLFRNNEIRRRHQLAINVCFAAELENIAFHRQQSSLQDQLISRQNTALETCIINATKHIHGAIFGLAPLIDKAEDACRLCHRLNDQHTWHDRLLREMAVEEGFVYGNILQRDNFFAGTADDPVYQQEGITVRQVIPDLGDVHTIPVVFCCPRGNRILLRVPISVPVLSQVPDTSKQFIQLACPYRILAPAGLFIE